jgi:hypothetical protein
VGWVFQERFERRYKQLFTTGTEILERGAPFLHFEHAGAESFQWANKIDAPVMWYFLSARSTVAS